VTIKVFRVGQLVALKKGRERGGAADAKEIRDALCGRMNIFNKVRVFWEERDRERERKG